MLRVGVCGTDREVVLHGLGGPRGLPEGSDYLVMGHEAVGRVVEIGSDVTDLEPGDLVVPTVRRGCGECVACAVGQADLPDTMTQEWWFDQDGFIRKFSSDFGQTTTTMTMSDWGGDVDIEAPPSDEVTTMPGMGGAGA